MGMQLCMDVCTGSQKDSPARILLLMRPTPSALNGFRVHHRIRVEALGYRISVDKPLPQSIRDVVTHHSATCEDPRPGQAVNFTSSKSPFGPACLGTCRQATWHDDRCSSETRDSSAQLAGFQGGWQLSTNAGQLGAQGSGCGRTDLPTPTVSVATIQAASSQRLPSSCGLLPSHSLPSKTGPCRLLLWPKDHLQRL